MNAKNKTKLLDVKKELKSITDITVKLEQFNALKLSENVLRLDEDCLLDTVKNIRYFLKRE